MIFNGPNWYHGEIFWSHVETCALFQTHHGRTFRGILVPATLNIDIITYETYRW